MTLEAQFAVAIGTRRIELELRVPAGTVTVVLGPNGAGKTTMLRTLAGLTAPGCGRILLDGRVLEDTDSGTVVPTEQRGLGMVFQDHQLFADLSVTENVAFGLRARGVSRAEARRNAQEWLERVGLGDVGDRHPRQLSGGQAQRVALARALAVSPALVLLDEPLSALDAETRAVMRSELREHLRALRAPTVLVTHDLEDAVVLADTVVVLEEGRITQQGTIAELSAEPRSPYVMELTRAR